MAFISRQSPPGLCRHPELFRPCSQVGPLLSLPHNFSLVVIALFPLSICCHSLVLILLENYSFELFVEAALCLPVFHQSLSEISLLLIGAYFHPERMGQTSGCYVPSCFLFSASSPAASLFFLPGFSPPCPSNLSAAGRLSVDSDYVSGFASCPAPSQPWRSVRPCRHEGPGAGVPSSLEGPRLPFSWEMFLNAVCQGLVQGRVPFSGGTPSQPVELCPPPQQAALQGVSADSQSSVS